MIEQSSGRIGIMGQEFAEPVLSRETAIACFKSLCALHQTIFEPAPEETCTDRGDRISTDDLILFAHRIRFDACLTQLTWPSLLSELSRHPTFLLLKNGNVVLALGNAVALGNGVRDSGDSGEHIVISDPLYQSGERCLLPRALLEKSWDGASLQVSRNSTKWEKFITRSIVVCVAGFILSAAYFFYNAAIEFSSYRVSRVNHNSDTIVPDRSSGLVGNIEETPTITGHAANSRDSTRDIAAVVPNSDWDRRQANFEENSLESESVLEKLRRRSISARFRDLYYHDTASTTRAEILPFAPDGTLTNRAKGLINGPTVRFEVSDRAEGGESDDTKQPDLTSKNEMAATGVLDQDRSHSINIVSLVSHGDSAFASGDVVTARLFYQRAADAADSHAALRLAETYDPRFLARANSDMVRSNSTVAAYWYRRARALGAEEAEAALRDLPRR